MNKTDKLAVVGVLTEDAQTEIKKLLSSRRHIVSVTGVMPQSISTQIGDNVLSTLTI